MKKEEIETAKSWFILAQIIAVVAGLFVIAGSNIYTPPSSLFDMAEKTTSLCYIIKGEIVKGHIPTNMQPSDFNLSNFSDFNIFNCMESVSEDFWKSIEVKNKLGIFLIIMGFLLVLNAILLWIIGKRKLKNKNFSLPLILVMDIGFLFYLLTLLFPEKILTNDWIAAGVFYGFIILLAIAVFLVYLRFKKPEYFEKIREKLLYGLN